MKVIQQLIRHFWKEGQLTKAQAQKLLDDGFCEAGDLPGLHPYKEAITNPLFQQRFIKQAVEALQAKGKKVFGTYRPEFRAYEIKVLATDNKYYSGIEMVTDEEIVGMGRKEYCQPFIDALRRLDTQLTELDNQVDNQQRLGRALCHC